VRAAGIDRRQQRVGAPLLDQNGANRASRKASDQRPARRGTGADPVIACCAQGLDPMPERLAGCGSRGDHDGHADQQPRQPSVPRSPRTGAGERAACASRYRISALGRGGRPTLPL